MTPQVGDKVVYTSGSGRRWPATVTAIPENPWHGYTPLPTVSLEFRNERGKLVRKARVLPWDGRFGRNRMAYEVAPT